MRLDTASIKKRIGEFFADIERHELLMLSGAIAYTTALALAPFLIIMLSILSFLSPYVQAEIVSQLTGLLGPEAGRTVQAIIGSAEAHPTFRGFSGIIGFVVLAVSASAIFAQLRAALDKVNEHKVTPEESKSGIWGFFKTRILSIGLVFGFIFLLIISLIVTTAMGAVFKGQEGLLWQAVSLVSNILVFSVLFSAIFHFIPTDKFPWSRCFKSGAVATVFFLIGKSLIALYLGKSAVGSAYGAAGSLIVLLVWLYYTSLTLLLSYEFSNNVLLHEDEMADGKKQQSQMHFQTEAPNPAL